VKPCDEFSAAVSSANQHILSYEVLYPWAETGTRGILNLWSHV